MAASHNKYELNLTPYIDLMSTLIVFLLMTAVWNQISVLSTDTNETSSSDATNSTSAKTQLSVMIMPHFLELSEDTTRTRIPHVQGAIDRKRLAQSLSQWKKKYPTKTDVILNTDNSVTYKMLISAFDEIVGNQFPDVGVNTQ